MSFRFVAVSDIHAHNWPACSSMTDQSVNSRLVDVCNELLRIRRYMNENKIKYLVHTGDLFHVRGKPPVEAVGLVYMILRQMRVFDKINILLLVGNHDLSIESDLHALAPFTDIAKVVGKPERFKWGEIECVGIPYASGIEQLQRGLALVRRRSTKLLMMHQGIHGVPVRSGYTPDELMKKKWLPKSTTLNLLGHYHEFQPVDKHSFYVGSLSQHNWGDEGIAKYFLDISLKGGRFKMKKVRTRTSRFVTLRPPAMDDVAGNFCRVVLPHIDQHKAEKLRKKLLAKGARWVEFEVSPHSDPSVELSARKVQFGKQMISEFVNNIDTTLDKGQLVELGEKILGSVRHQ